MQACAVFGDGWGELDRNLGVAFYETLGCLFAEDFDAGPALDVKLDEGLTCGVGGGERGALDSDAVSASVVLVELRA